MNKGFRSTILNEPKTTSHLIIKNMITNSVLVQNLINKGVLKSQKNINVMRSVDRKDFVIESEKENAYTDYPLPIPCGQTITRPSQMAFILEFLDIQKGEKVLEVGSGSGWGTAILAELVGKTGQVWSVEIKPELVEFGIKNLQKYNFTQVNLLQARSTYGLPEHAPYDKIIISASGDKLEEAFFNQLKIGGKMTIPTKDKLVLLTKQNESEYKTKSFKGFVFVPLIKPADQITDTSY